MREILFRGKRIDNGEWVYGHYGEYMLMSGESISCISIPNKEAVCGSICCDVEASTVGQYTGLTDKNGKKIFEGDIVSTVDGNYLIFCDDFDGFHYGMKREVTGGYTKFEPLSFYECEVIGNIHDNPELLEVDE